MRIPTDRIPGYAEMTVEEKLKALEEFEYEDNAKELTKLRDANNKLSSENADWKRKHNALLSEEEKAKADAAGELDQLKQQVAELTREKTVADYRSRYLALGYSEDLASSTAAAMVDGDAATVFENQQKFVAQYTQSVKSDVLKATPKPPVGSGDGSFDYEKQIQSARENGDMAAVAYYTRLSQAAENK